MFVTALTGSASILMRPPDISSTMFFQSMNISWKRSFPAHPDWIFHVIAFAAAATVGAAELVPAAPVPAGVALVCGAFCERHAVRNAPTPESEPYLRKPRRDSFERNVMSTSNLSGTAATFDSDRFAMSSEAFDWRETED